MLRVAAANRPGQVMAMALSLDRKLILVSGPDAHAFLQGLLTQDLAPMAKGERRVAYAALLSPQGKIVTDMFVWAARPLGSAILDVDPSRVDDLKRRLAMYRLRSQVTIEDVDDVGTVFADLDDIGVPDPRFPRGEMGNREALEVETMPDSGASAYFAKRLALGVPDLAVDAAPEEVFALEALLEELNGVAFDKGCFVGQENVSRMKRRATTRRKFCPVVFDGDAIVYGTPVLAGEAEIGSVRTGAAGRALALLRLDRAIDAVAAGLTLTANGREIRLDPPPWLILPQREDAPG